MSRIIIIGLGGVGTAFLEMLVKTEIGLYILKNYKQIIIFDMKDKRDESVIIPLKDKIILNQLEITEKNINILLNSIHENDLVLDVSYNIYFYPIIKHCLKINANYVNTSLERWPLENEADINSNFIGRALHEMNNEIEELKGPGPSIVVLHGMNPGLISHFGFLGIYNIAKMVLEEAKRKSRKLPGLEKAFQEKNFPIMAYLLDLQTIHCSEKDTQIPIKSRKKGEFMNTWGPYSFYSEGVDPIQLGWGTHEPKKPLEAIVSSPIDNQIYLPVRGVDMYAESHTYNSVIRGMLISHSENDTISKKLTVYDINGKVLYRPSAYYVYSPCNSAWDSIKEVKDNKYEMLETQKALRGPDIKSGEDAVGSLLIFGSNPIERLVYNRDSKPVSYWSGTILNIEDTRKMGFINSGPTVVQVGASLLAVIKYIINNPGRGILFPEDLPYNEILEDSIPFLGKIFTDWVPFSITDFKPVK